MSGARAPRAFRLARITLVPDVGQLEDVFHRIGELLDVYADDLADN